MWALLFSRETRGSRGGAGRGPFGVLKDPFKDSIGLYNWVFWVLGFRGPFRVPLKDPFKDSIGLYNWVFWVWGFWGLGVLSGFL